MAQVSLVTEQAVFNVVSGEWTQKTNPLSAWAVARTQYGEATPVQLSWAGAPLIVIPSGGEMPYFRAESRTGLTWGDPATDTLTLLPGGESYQPWRFRSQMNLGTLCSVSYEVFWYADAYYDAGDVTTQVNWFTFDFLGTTVLRQDCPTAPNVGELELTMTYDPLVPRARAQMTYQVWDEALGVQVPVTYTIDIDDPPTITAAGPVTDFRVGVAHRLPSVNLPAGHWFAYVGTASAFQVPAAPAAGESALVRGISAETCGDAEC